MIRPKASWMSTSLIAIAAVLAVVGCSPSADDSTLAPQSQSTVASLPSVAPSAVTPTTLVASPDPVAGELDASADGVLLASLYSLLDVGTGQELVAFLSSGVPAGVLATCMTDAGFQYVEGSSEAVQAASDPRYTLPASEYAARYGLGITAGDLGLLPPLPPDPNFEFVSSLNSGQRDAYYRARTDCFEQTDPDGMTRSTALSVALEPFRESLAVDGRVVAAAADWKACMAASGFNFDSPSAMTESFYIRMNGGADLTALNTEEVTVAVANVSCQSAYTAAYRDVVAARFAEFKALFETAVSTGEVPEAVG